ncbi:hypothetical protein FSARC_2570 [Fusarium sarcochroum]|uniref:Uncharacterized protein n=1 Tax=Fusarium sarcochroum TaxID=1208366 RepID=A0A8H4U699_9HYPO|nr:hypothetical protein FSARC_2570 [Fusarium sarcochroum]
MTMRRYLTSALAMAAAVTAAPTGRSTETRDLVTATSYTAAATHTAVIAYDPSSTVPTETVAFTPSQSIYHDVEAHCSGPNCSNAGSIICKGSNCGGSGRSGHSVFFASGPPGDVFIPGRVPGYGTGEFPGPPGPHGPGQFPGPPGQSGSEGSSFGGSTAGGSNLHGIGWATFRKDGSCKTKEQIHDDLSRFEGTYSLVRTYGTECDQVAHAYSWSKSSSMKLFLGVYKMDDIQGETQRIIDGVNRDWDNVDTIGVGNEHVTFGTTAANAVSALKQVRQMVREAGYQGPVVWVDTSGAVINHPELCNESDYCAINAHAFFDSSVAAEESGDWLSKTINNVRAKLSDQDQRIVVCETGWPHRGDTNGRAVPGLPQQQAALTGIRELFTSNPKDLILFSGYNDPWKKSEPATFHAEQFWGINDAKSSADL